MQSIERWWAEAGVRISFVVRNRLRVAFRELAWGRLGRRGAARTCAFVVHTRLWEAFIYACRVCTTDACWGRAGEPDETMQGGMGLLCVVGGGWPTGGRPHAQSGTSNGSSSGGGDDGSGGIGGNRELG